MFNKFKAFKRLVTIMYCLSVIIFIIQVPYFVQWQAPQTLGQQNLAPIQTRMTGHTIIIVFIIT